MKVPPLYIIERTAKLCGVSVGDILNKSRRSGRKVQRSRTLAMAVVCHVRDDLSYPVIGKCFRGRLHCTIMYHEGKAKKIRASDPDFAKDFETLVSEAFSWVPPEGVQVISWKGISHDHKVAEGV